MMVNVAGVLTASVLGYILPSLIFFKINDISLSDILRTLHVSNIDLTIVQQPKARVPLHKDYALSILFVIFGMFILVGGMGLQLFGAVRAALAAGSRS